MYFWIFIFLFVCIMWFFSISTNNTKYKKILAITTMIILCVISGTRFNTGGSDYFAYKNIYNNIKLMPFWKGIIETSKYSGFESGFCFYMSVIKLIGFNYYGFTLINSVVFYILFYKVLKKYDYNINFILILFLYKIFFYNTFISLRQPIAILIFWLSLDYLKEKKYIKYFLMCTLAFTFHKAAIILYFVPLVTHFKISKKTYIIFLVTCLFLYAINFSSIINMKSILDIFFANDQVTMDKAEGYAEVGSGMSVFYIFESYLIAILIGLKYNEIYNYDDKSSFFIKLFLCVIPFYTVFSGFAIVTRFKDFFFLAYPILITYIAKSQKKIAPYIYLFTIIICFYGYIRYLNNFDGGAFLNYKTFLFENLEIFR